MLSPFEKAVISAFAVDLALAGNILSELSGSMPSPFNEQDVARRIGLSAGQEPSVLGCLRTAEKLGIIREIDAGWQMAKAPENLKRLGELLEAVGYYKSEAHHDDNTVSVVLTRPGHPSRLEAELENLGWKTASLELTEEAFLSLAANAKEHLVVMTPFLDLVGARWLISLFERTAPEVKRRLILRYLGMPAHPSYPTGYDAIAAALSEIGVEVFDYALTRENANGYETFHAKVVLADRAMAYVGSSNMNKASLEHSMEMGVVVEGKAAQHISRVLDTIMKVADRQKSPWPDSRPIST